MKNENDIIEGNYEEVKNVENQHTINNENENNYNFKNSKKQKKKRRKPFKAILLTLVVGGAGFYAGRFFSNYDINFTITEKGTEEVVVTTSKLNADEGLEKENSSLVFNNESKEIETGDQIEKEIASNDFQEATNSVVSISAQAIQNQGIFSGIGESSGSGVIFATDDEYVYMLTNRHVVSGVTTFEISIDDETFIEARVLGTDTQNDIAVIYAKKEQFEENDINYSIAKIGDSDQLQLGDKVYAIGNSAGEGKSLTSGVVGALNKEIDFGDGTSNSFIQTDAAINPGNSGGALIDENGYLVGINTAKLVDSSIEGMGYSIPINDAIQIAENLLTKPFIGIQGGTVSDIIDTRNARNIPDGVYIDAVVVDSGADEAGLKRGDIITQMNEAEIAKFEDLSKFLDNYKVGDVIEVVIFRDGDYLKVEVMLGSRANY